MGVGYQTGMGVLDKGWGSRQGWGSSRQEMGFQTWDGVPDRRSDTRHR